MRTSRAYIVARLRAGIIRGREPARANREQRGDADGELTKCTVTVSFPIPYLHVIAEQ